jgi:hypothetical protein
MVHFRALLRTPGGAAGVGPGKEQGRRVPGAGAGARPSNDALKADPKRVYGLHRIFIDRGPLRAG